MVFCSYPAHGRALVFCVGREEGQVVAVHHTKNCFWKLACRPLSSENHYTNTPRQYFWPYKDIPWMYLVHLPSKNTEDRLETALITPIFVGLLCIGPGVFDKIWLAMFKVNNFSVALRYLHLYRVLLKCRPRWNSVACPKTVGWKERLRQWQRRGGGLACAWLYVHHTDVSTLTL